MYWPTEVLWSSMPSLTANSEKSWFCGSGYLTGLQDVDLLLVHSVSVLFQKAFTLIFHLSRKQPTLSYLKTMQRYHGKGMHCNIASLLHCDPSFIFTLTGQSLISTITDKCGKQRFTVSLQKLKLTFCIHPSIFYLPPFRVAGAYPSGHRTRGRKHPGQVASPSQGTDHSLTHSYLKAI